MEGISHIKETCLYIKDLDQAEQFYHKLLKFPLIARVQDRHIFFRVGQSVLLCFNADVTKNDSHLPPHFAYGNQHMAFQVSRDNYWAIKDTIKQLGVDIIHEEHWRKGVESFYFCDPENNVLEIVPEGMWEP